MDKNQLIGFILIMMIVFAWSILTAPTQEELERQKYVQDSIKQAELALEQGISKDYVESTYPDSQQVIVNDSLEAIQRSNTYGDFAQSATGTEQNYTLGNSLIELQFTNKGGRINKATLNEHMKITQDEDFNETKHKLELFEDEKNKFEYLLPINGKVISTEDLYFEGVVSGNTARFKANAGAGYIEQIYTLQPDSYKLDYDLNIVGLQNNLDRDEESIKLNWVNYLDKLEINEQFERYYVTTYYKKTDEDSDYCSCRADDEVDELDESIKWVSSVNQFFNTSLIAEEEPFAGADFEVKLLDEDNDNLKLLKSEILIPYNHGSSESFAMSMFVGPNEFNRLKSIGVGLEEVIPYGRSLFGTLNRYVVRPSFNFLNKYISSKGIVIIVLIFILKMLLYPLMFKMLHSQAKMGALKPQVQKLTEKFKDEPQKKQMESMKIYREYGVSPLGGCMPMVLQMPIWYALFRFFPADITFRQEPFLWATDLSSFDVIARLPFEIPMSGAHISLFTILWAVTQVAYTYYNTKHMDLSANPAMKYVQYAMPLMFLVFFNSYASGLTCYMFFSMLFTILQTVITKKFVFDDEKLLAELNKEKAKPKKKKTGFQARLEEAMRQSQQANEKKNKAGKKKK